jgi:hypothetical protein
LDLQLCARRACSRYFHPWATIKPKLIPKRVAILTTVLALFAFNASAFAEYQYERALKGKALVEGLGFEGAVTVFDETPRMFRRLGHPNTFPRFPLWYFYEAGDYKITVNAEYRDGRFQVKSIQYSNDRQRRFVTDQGIRLRDPVQRIIDLYGEPDAQPTVNTVKKTNGRALSYRTRGITFHVGKASTVIGITVFRTVRDESEEDAIKPGENEPVKDTGDAPVHVVKPNPERLIKPAALGLSLILPEGWSSVLPLTEKGGTYAEKAGRLSLNIIACRDCKDSIEQRVAEFEKQRPNNRIPEAQRWLSEEAAGARNAAKVYMGLFVENSDNRPTWLVALQSGQNVVLVSLVAKKKEPLVPKLQRHVVSILKQLRLVP